MPEHRRAFLKLLSGSVAAGVLGTPTASAVVSKPAIKAIAFDAFPIFDPRPIFARAEQLFPGKGAELGNAWRTRQFEYQWLRALAGQYIDFREATESALVFAARQLKLDLTPEKQRRLMQGYHELKAWPDVPVALTELRRAGLRLVFLSNMTRSMLEAGIAHAGLKGNFDAVLSTDSIKSYKPDPRAYHLAVDALGLRKQEILFVAFAGWDAAGAKWFGYPTFWLNRSGAPAENLGVMPDASGAGMADLVSFVNRAGSTAG